MARQMAGSGADAIDEPDLEKLNLTPALEAQARPAPRAVPGSLASSGRQGVSTIENAAVRVSAAPSDEK